MSIDQRLRSGLEDNTRFLGADVDTELARVLRRARRRRLSRISATLAATAAVAAVAWLLVTVDLARDDARPVAPDPIPVDLMGVVGPLAPGTYALHTWGEPSDGRDVPQAVFEVPEGYFSNGGYVIDAGSDTGDDDLGTVQLGRVTEVFADPCDTRTAEPVARSVTAVVEALVDQRGPSTQPVPVELDGHRGLYLEVTVPAGKDLISCTHGEYPLWRTRPDEMHAHSGMAGMVHHLWVLDVDGELRVLAVGSYPDQPVAQRAELLAIAETVQFEPGKG